MNGTSSGSNVVSNLSTFNTSANLPYVDAPNTRTTMHSNDSLLPVTDDSDSDSSDDEYGNIRLLTEHVEALSLATDAGRSTFHGKSSLTGVIVQVAQAIPPPPPEIDSPSHSTAISQRHLISWMTARVYIYIHLARSTLTCCIRIGWFQPSILLCRCGFELPRTIPTTRTG